MQFDCGDQCASNSVGNLVKLQDAVGLVLAHDMTQVIPGKSKAPVFKKGHVVTPEDLPKLASMGKQHLYVLFIRDDELHENQAAEMMSQALCGPGVIPFGPPSEGKITLMAAHDGLFSLDLERLLAFNMVPEVTCATIHRHSPVKQGQLLAGTRAIPLIIKRAYVEEACALAAREGGLLRVLPFQSLRVGIVVTGNEVASGLIEDRFAGIVEKKLTAHGCSVLGVKICPDDRSAVAAAIRALLEAGAQMIITTAGMSVDPDDVTRQAIAEAGGRDLLYGAPILPGNMFLVGNLDGPHGQVPILGVPACALFHATTVLDVMLPRVLAGESFDRAKLAALAHGGFCQNCAEGCRFPVCGFGRGA